MQILGELARYNRWANARVFALCREVDAGALSQAAAGTTGSIADTLKHLVQVEEGYLKFIRGEDPLKDRPDIQAYLKEYMAHDLGWFADRVAEVDPAYEEIIAAADNAFLAGEFRLPWFAFPLTNAQGLLQALTHSATHRAQVLSTLGDRGVSVPDMDYVHMLQEEARR